MLKIKHIFCFPKSALMPHILFLLEVPSFPHICLHVAYHSHLWRVSLFPELHETVVKSNYFFLHKVSYICCHCQHPVSDLGYVFSKLFWWVSNCSCWLYLCSSSHLYSSSRIFLNPSYHVSTSILICMPTACYLKSSRIWPYLNNQFSPTKHLFISVAFKTNADSQVQNHPHTLGTSIHWGFDHRYSDQEGPACGKSIHSSKLGLKTVCPMQILSSSHSLLNCFSHITSILYFSSLMIILFLLDHKIYESTAHIFFTKAHSRYYITVVWKLKWMKEYSHKCGGHLGNFTYFYICQNVSQLMNALYKLLCHFFIIREYFC